MEPRPPRLPIEQHLQRHERDPAQRRCPTTPGAGLVTSVAANKVDGEAVAGALDKLLDRELDRETLLEAARSNEPLGHLHGHLVALGLPVVALEHEFSGFDLSLSAIAEVFAVVGRRLVPAPAVC